MAAQAKGEVLTSAEDAYTERFKAIRPRLSVYRFYVLTPRSVKLFDESELGGGSS
jgi:hypothetical protein